MFKAAIMEFLQFRIGAAAMFLGNIIYLIVIYYLWRAIFNSVDNAVVNGMTFESTMIYLVLASAQFTFMEAFLVWYMGRSVISGKIVLDLLKPMSYDVKAFFEVDSGNFAAFVITFIPTFIIVEIITHCAVPLGMNLLYYCISALLGSLINFAIDFLVGTICIYTQSIWGINIMKEVVVLFLSGATVPLAFFPEKLKEITLRLPFHAIYNTPLTILTDGQMAASRVGLLLLEQLFWVVVLIGLGKLFFKVSTRVITVNGG